MKIKVAVSNPAVSFEGKVILKGTQSRLFKTQSLASFSNAKILNIFRFNSESGELSRLGLAVSLLSDPFQELPRSYVIL